MTEAFETPTDLRFNRGPIADPEAFARDAGAASWVYLCGEAFANMEAGATADDVLARADADSAPFCGSTDLRAWAEQGLAELS